MVSTTAPALGKSEGCWGSASFPWREDESVRQRRRQRARRRQFLLGTVLAFFAVSALLIIQSGAAISLGTAFVQSPSVDGR